MIYRFLKIEKFAVFRFFHHKISIFEKIFQDEKRSKTYVFNVFKHFKFWLSIFFFRESKIWKIFFKNRNIDFWKSKNFQFFGFFIIKYQFLRKFSRTKNVPKHTFSTFFNILSFDFQYFFSENRKSEKLFFKNRKNFRFSILWKKVWKIKTQHV